MDKLPVMSKCSMLHLNLFMFQRAGQLSEPLQVLT